MIFIVSGFMRSGTSMMMRALEAGGLEAAYDSSRDVMNDKFGDDNYKINPGSFYEILPMKYRGLNFPLDYRGKLIKVLLWGLTNMWVHEYKIVFMLRDFEEIRQSWEAAFAQPEPAPEPEVQFEAEPEVDSDVLSELLGEDYFPPRDEGAVPSRLTALEDLDVGDLRNPGRYIAVLKENGIENAFQIVAWNTEHEGGLQEIDGIGPKAAERFTEAANGLV